MFLVTAMIKTPVLNLNCVNSYSFKELSRTSSVRCPMPCQLPNVNCDCAQWLSVARTHNGHRRSQMGFSVSADKSFSLPRARKQPVPFQCLPPSYWLISHPDGTPFSDQRQVTLYDLSMPSGTPSPSGFMSVSFRISLR